MEAIWQKVCHHYDVPEDVSKSWYTRIQEHLSANEPTRAYHNWNEMLRRKQEYLDKCKPSMVLAVLFQYYEFDGKRSCVDENCAAFKEFCNDAMIEDEETKCLVLRLLGDKANEGELSLCYDDEANFLQDLDLAVLGSSPEDYKTYTELLRQEYANVSEQNFKQMRLRVLETLLMIPNIYATEEFQSKYEATARLNIKNEIGVLKR